MSDSHTSVDTPNIMPLGGRSAVTYQTPVICRSLTPRLTDCDWLANQSATCISIPFCIGLGVQQETRSLSLQYFDLTYSSSYGGKLPSKLYWLPTDLFS